MTTSEEILRAVNNLTETVEASRRDVRDLYVIIKGDGTQDNPGLNARVLLQEQKCKDMHKASPWAGVIRSIVQIVAAAAILAIAATLFGLWKSH